MQKTSAYSSSESVSKLNSYSCGALLNGSYLSNDFFKTGSEFFFLLVYSVNNLHLWPSLLQQLFLDRKEQFDLDLNENVLYF